MPLRLRNIYMNASPLLSVCLPTYNRRSYLERVLESFDADPASSQVELVVVDDGSTDGTSEWLEEQWGGCSSLRRLVVQENRGRFGAVRKGMALCSGKYAMTWDSDDLFADGALTTILRKLNEAEERPPSERPLCGVIGLAVDPQGTIIGDVFPNDDAVTNFLEARADWGVRGDKKEVVLTDAFREALRGLPDTQRRVATSLLLNRVARRYDVLTLNQPLVVKDYLDGGMSATLTALRRESAVSSYMAYGERVEAFMSGCYRSRRYLFSAFCNAWRYAMHARSFKFIVATVGLSYFWSAVSFPFGAALCLSDRFASVLRKRA